MKIETIITEKRPKQVFAEIPEEYFDFKPGIRVLSSEMEHLGDSTPVFFVKKHAPGTPHWKEGGIECQDINGNFRAFHLDGCIIHPNEMKSVGVTFEKHGVEGEVKRRGRKRTKPIVIKDPNAPKGKRGRKPLSPEEKKRRQLLLIDKPKGKRGRPLMDPSLRKTQPQKLKGYGRRGRPSKEMIELLNKNKNA